MWVVVFHVSYHIVMFATREQFEEYWLQDSLFFGILRNGLAAVDIFFILTGFLLAQPVLAGEQTGSWRSFVWRRVTRVYPSYVASTSHGHSLYLPPPFSSALLQQYRASLAAVSRSLPRSPAS